MSLVDHQASYVDEVLGRLDTVVADLCELSLLSLGLADLDRVLARTVCLVSQAQGLEYSVVQEADAAGVCALSGSRVLTTHLVKATHQPAKTLGSDRALALWLNDFTQFHDAMLAGTLSRSHVVELKAIDSPRVRQLLVRDQGVFVDAAARFVWDEWKQVVAYWLNAADPDGELCDPADPKYGTWVDERTNGDVAVRMLLDSVEGEAFLSMHDAELNKIEAAERQALKNDPNYQVLLPSQKNSHAVLRLMLRGWRREDGSYPGFLVNLVMSEKVAEDSLARWFGHVDPSGESPLDIDPFQLPIRWDDLDGRCETIRGRPVHPKHALGVLLVARLRRLVMSAESKVVDHGTDVRFFTDTQRNALLVQQRGQCAFGTQAPFRWLQADHIKPASKAGPTSLANGQMINRADNQAKGNTTTD